MHRLRHLRSIVACGTIRRQGREITLGTIRCEISSGLRALSVTAYVCAEAKSTAKPLCSTKPKAKNSTLQHFVDIRPVRAVVSFYWDVISL